MSNLSVSNLIDIYNDTIPVRQFDSIWLGKDIVTFGEAIIDTQRRIMYMSRETFDELIRKFGVEIPEGSFVTFYGIPVHGYK